MIQPAAEPALGNGGRHGRVVILGIGNALLSDDGIGVHAVRHLRKSAPSDVDLVDGGTAGFELLAAMESACALVVIDAAMLGGSPGALRLFVGQAMDRFLGRPKRTAHEVGLRDLIDMARLEEILPTRRALIAVQPQSIDWGEAPTPAVAAALPHAAALAIALADKWSRSSQPASAHA